MPTDGFSSSTDTQMDQAHSYSIDSPAPTGGMSDSTKAGLKSAGAAMSKQGQKGISDAADKLASQDRGVPSYKKGGKVRKTGLARLHKGEEVIPKGKAEEVRKDMKTKKDTKHEDSKNEDIRPGKDTSKKLPGKKMDKKHMSKKTSKRMKGKRGGSRG